MALTDVVLFRHLADRLEAWAWWLVDSAPVETAAFVRSQSAAVSIPNPTECMDKGDG